MTRHEQLKPCPFCGSAATLEDDRLQWVVRCTGCGTCVLGERAEEPEHDLPASYWEPFRQSAIDRWNRRAALAQPEPVGPTDEELDELFTEIDQSGESQSWRAYARAVLQRWCSPAITPIPVSERLPEAQDCDAQGRCWWWHSEDDRADAAWLPGTPADVEGLPVGTFSHWLPAHALPLPGQPVPDAPSP